MIGQAAQLAVSLVVFLLVVGAFAIAVTLLVWAVLVAVFGLTMLVGKAIERRRRRQTLAAWEQRRRIR